MPDLFKTFYVPARWAQRLLAVIETQIIRVTSSPFERGVGSDPKRSEIVHQLIGHKFDETKTVIAFGGWAHTTKDAPSVTLIDS